MFEEKILRWRTGLVNKGIGCGWGRCGGIKTVSGGREDKLGERGEKG